GAGRGGEGARGGGGGRGWRSSATTRGRRTASPPRDARSCGPQASPRPPRAAPRGSRSSSSSATASGVPTATPRTRRSRISSAPRRAARFATASRAVSRSSSSSPSNRGFRKRVKPRVRGDIRRVRVAKVMRDGRYELLVLSVALAAVVAFAALVGVSWAAVWDAVLDRLRRPHPQWFAAAFAAELLAYSGYVLAYREAARVERWP